MKTVAQLLQGKPSGVVAVRPDVPVLEALKVLAEKDIGAVLVMDGTRLLGIFTERDYARKVVLKGKSSNAALVKEIMTTEVMFVTSSQTNEDCMALMTQKHLRHLPVIDGEQVVGVLSIGDLVKDVISEQQFTIKQLEQYIHS